MRARGRGARAGDEGPLSRREFLRLAGAAAAAGGLGCTTVSAGGAPGAEPARFDAEVDVVVAGSGAAGSVAALFAGEGGGEILLLEKAPVFGGTTARSGGVYWIPNNAFLRARGAEAPRDATLHEMARHAYPHLYDPDDARLGLPANELELLVAFYDEGPGVVDALAAMGALVSQPADIMVGPLPDYFDTERGDGEPVDRRLWPRKPDGSFGLGDEMVRQLREALEHRGVDVRLRHRVRRLLVDARRAVVGAEAETPDGAPLRVRARRGVFFGTGGFTHSRDLVLHYQPGPVFGGCAVPTNEGDFVYMAAGAGARLGHMHSAWRAQVVLEQALQFSSTPDDVFMPPGDSMVLVNRYGRRVVNETANYNERTRVHYAWDPVRHEWPNLLLFMVYDARSAARFGGRFPIPAPETTAPYVLRADTLPALGAALDERLAELAPATGGVRLDGGFAGELARSISRFNRSARAGRDVEFARGAQRYDRLWHARIWSYPNPDTPPNPHPNVTMHPIAPEGPYFAIALAPGTLDTNGGPVTNARGQVLGADGAPIPGLFAAGNCAASATGPYYFGGGGTLGPAITFAALAGRALAAEPVRAVA